MIINHKVNNLFHKDLIKKNKNKKILVILYIFYNESFKEIKYYLSNLDNYQYDLYVSLSQSNDNQKIIDQIKNFKNNAHIEIVKNVGYDIYLFYQH